MVDSVPLPPQKDVRRTTERLLAIVRDAGDDFLAYLFEMAIIHMDELADRSAHHNKSPSASPDPDIAPAAKLVTSAKPRACGCLE
jgi:hypothetical protein